MSLSRLLSTAVLTMGLCSPSSADTFFFSSPDADAMRARVIEGVLLEEVDGNYRIRVEGGEITVSKSLVTKVEKDALSVADLEQREQDARSQLATANQERRARQSALLDERNVRRREAMAAEASVGRSSSGLTTDVVQRAAPVYGFDPVVGRVVVLDGLVEAELRRELGGEIRRAAQRELRSIRRELRRSLRRIR